MTPIELVLSKLSGVKRNGQGWIACCPAHDDRRASLSVSEGDDGRALLHCHAGCDVPSIVAALDLEMSSLFPGTTSPNGEVTATYQYLDANGQLVYEVVRKGGKRFLQRRPDGNGGWIWNLDGVPRVLYRLPELLAADPGALVFIVEGEKDVDRLRALGRVATCNPGGAGKWKHVDDTPLHGRNVCILPDNDAPGRAHAADVAARLHGKAASITIIELPDLPEKSDIADWIAAGGTEDDLIAAIERAEEWTPPPEDTNERDENQKRPSPDDGENKSRLDIVCLADVDPKPVEWLWSHRFPKGHFSIIAGMQDFGKSFITLDMAARMTSGLPWPDDNEFSVPHKAVCRNVILLALEDGVADTIRPRADAMGADVKRIHVIRGTAEVDHSGQRTFDVTRDIALLEEAIDRIGNVGLVVFDPLNAYLGDKVNSYKDNEVRAALYPLGQLAEHRNLTIIGLMHLTKTPRTKAMFRVIGSVGYTSYARAVWMVGEDKEGQDGDRVFLPVKMNLAKPAPGLCYRIDEPGVVKWLGSTDIKADDAFSDESQNEDTAGPVVTEVMEWLRRVLADGAQLSKEITEQAKELGYKEATLRRAKLKLDVQSTNGGCFRAPWYLYLPGQEPVLPSNTKGGSSRSD